MGNQAQQSPELELWEVVSRSENVQAEPVRQGRQNAQQGYDQHRGGNSKAAVKTKTSSSADQIKIISSERVRTSKSGTQSTRRVQTARQSTQDAGKARAVYQDVPNTGRARTARPDPQRTRSVRSEYSQSAKQRTSTPRAKTQPVKKKKVGRRARISQMLAIAWVMVMSIAVMFMGKIFYQSMQKSPQPEENNIVKSILEDIPVISEPEKKPEIREDFLTVSEYNRPGTRLATVKNIFVHYTANQGTSAAQNRSYFENLGQTHERAASAHFIIGYEGEIIQCIPLEEEAYAVVEHNEDSISIECCYLEEDGSFTQATYDSLIEMLAWLIDKYDLQPEDILRHYDCGGKKCPLYYVEHEDAWQQLLKDVAEYKNNSL